MDEREIVYDMLLATLKDGFPTHHVLNQTLQKYQYADKRERAFISRLYRGVLEYQITLDDWIFRFVTAKKKGIRLQMMIILRMGAFQILYMDHVPDAAACNESVKLAKKHGFRHLAGFVNGVLRNIVRFKNEPVLPDPDQEPVRFLSLCYSLPSWLVQMWYDRFGFDGCSMIGRYMLNPSALSVRVRDLKDIETVTGRLQAQKVSVLPGTIMPQALRIEDFDHLGSLDVFLQGKCMVQDEGAMLAAAAAGAAPGMQIIDVCAAPGGKSIYLADMLRGSGSVSARDLTPAKTARIEENIRRCGASCITAMVQDALVLRQEDICTADIVMADLPCSGLGVIGKKPDIKLRMTPDQITALAKLQRDILTVCWQYVKPGGILLYATCTVSEEENEANMRWFEANFPFELTSLDPYIPEHLWGETTKKGWIQILPGQYASDGFFIARFKRSGENE